MAKRSTPTTKKRTGKPPKSGERLPPVIEAIRERIEAKGGRLRIGRPIKPPREGERVSLGLRVTPEMKRKLEQAAIKSGRSLSQEVERRLDRSLDFDRHLVIAQGDFWAPLLTHKGDVLVMLGDDPRDYPVPEGDPPHQEALVVLKGTPRDVNRMFNYFGGAPWPYDHSTAEIEAAGDEWMRTQDEIKRGK